MDKKRLIRQKTEENTVLRRQLASLNVAVNERRHIHEVIGWCSNPLARVVYVWGHFLIIPPLPPPPPQPPWPPLSYFTQSPSPMIPLNRSHHHILPPHQSIDLTSMPHPITTPMPVSIDLTIIPTIRPPPPTP